MLRACKVKQRGMVMVLKALGLWAEVTGTGFCSSPQLGLKGSCNSEQDKGPSPRKLQPFRKEEKTHNDLTNYLYWGKALLFK